MKVKLTAREMELLQRYTDLEGRGILKVMARLHFRTSDAGELWLGQEDFEELARFAPKHLPEIKAVFGRIFQGQGTFLDKYE